MGLMSEYINRKPSITDLQSELLSLIGKYNQIRNTFTILYVAAINKPIPNIAMLSISEMGHFLNRTLWHDQAALTSSLRPRL